AGQTGICGLSDERVTECVFGLVRITALRASYDDLPSGELAEVRLDDVRDAVLAPQLAHGTMPEYFAQDARCPQRAPLVGFERVEAHLHHGQNGSWELLPSIFGDGANELL